MAKTKIGEEFAIILLEAIDEALSTLGENVKISIYFHLEAKFSISRQEIPSKIKDFSAALERIFGQASKKLEILIMRCLNEKVHCNYKWVGPRWLVADLTFEKYVELVRHWFEDTSEIDNVEELLNEKERTRQKT